MWGREHYRSVGRDFSHPLSTLLRQTAASLRPSLRIILCFLFPFFLPLLRAEELNERSFSPPSSYLQQSFERQLCRAVCSWLRGPFFFHLLLLFYSPHPTSSCPSLHSHHAPPSSPLQSPWQDFMQPPIHSKRMPSASEAIFPPGKVMHTFAQRSMEAFGAKKFLPKRCLQDFFFASLLSVPSRQAHGPLHRSYGVKENGLRRRIGRHSLLKPITCPLCPHSKHGGEFEWSPTFRPLPWHSEGPAVRRGPPPLPSSHNIDQGKACTTVPVGEGGDLLCSFGGAFSFFKWVPLFLP